MCKQLIVPSIPDSTDPRKLWRFLAAIRQPMAQTNPHGIGLAALTPGGELGAMRWLDPKESFREIRPLRGPLARYAAALEHSSARAWHSGAPILGAQVGAVLLHARYATSGRDLPDTHPHLDAANAAHAGVCLVHNGVVNSATLDTVHSDCDSELLVQAYAATRAVEDPTALSAALAEHIQGYHAFGALVFDGEAWVCDIVRDDRANLSACHVAELGCVVWTTDAGDVVATCKALKWRVPECAAMRELQHLRLSVATGEIIHQGAIQVPRRSAPSLPSAYLSSEAEAVYTALAGGRRDIPV